MEQANTVNRMKDDCSCSLMTVQGPPRWQFWGNGGVCKYWRGGSPKLKFLGVMTNYYASIQASNSGNDTLWNVL